MLSQKETIMVFRVAFYEFDAARNELKPALTIEFHAMRSNFEASKIFLSYHRIKLVKCKGLRANATEFSHTLRCSFRAKDENVSENIHFHKVEVSLAVHREFPTNRDHGAGERG